MKKKKEEGRRKDEKKSLIFKKEESIEESVQISLKIIRNGRLAFIKLTEDIVGWNRVKT